MIEALGVLIYNREDLLAKLVASIDHPVGQLVIVNNGQISGLHERVNAWVESSPKVQSWVVYEPGQNLGVAGGWNVLLHHAFLGVANVSVQFPFTALEIKPVDSILICGNDIEFNQGDLSIFEKTLTGYPAADFIFGNHSYSNFMVKRSGYEKCGTFNEEFWPGYLEDSSHWQTIRHTGAMVCPALGVMSHHHGSATINSDASIRALSDANRRRGWEYYARRHGCPPWSAGQEKFKHPFNDPNYPHTKWDLSPERLIGPHYLTGNP